MNTIDPEKRQQAVDLLKSGASIRAVTKAVGIHRVTVCSIKQSEGIKSKPRKKRAIAKPTKGKGEDEFSAIPMSKWKRQYLRQKARGELNSEICQDCGQPRHNGSAARCYNCWRRTAALKKLAKNHPDDSPEYEAGLLEILATNFNRNRH